MAFYLPGHHERIIPQQAELAGEGRPHLGHAFDAAQVGVAGGQQATEATDQRIGNSTLNPHGVELKNGKNEVRSKVYLQNDYWTID